MLISHADHTGVRPVPILLIGRRLAPFPAEAPATFNISQQHPHLLSGGSALAGIRPSLGIGILTARSRTSVCQSADVRMYSSRCAPAATPVEAPATSAITTAATAPTPAQPEASAPAVGSTPQSAGEQVFFSDIGFHEDKLSSAYYNAIPHSGDSMPYQGLKPCNCIRLLDEHMHCYFPSCKRRPGCTADTEGQ